jgi:hypothetical protein
MFFFFVLKFFCSSFFQFMFYFFNFYGVMTRSPLNILTTSGPIVPVSVIDDYEAFGGIRIGRGKPKHSENTCSSATLSTTYPTWPDLGSKPDLRGGKPASKCQAMTRHFLCLLLISKTEKKNLGKH